MTATTGDREFYNAPGYAMAKPMFSISQPPCPKCKTTTMLGRITRGLSGFDIRTFECPVCNDIHQMVIDLVDPMKSAKTNGWLHGQLQAPT